MNKLLLLLSMFCLTFIACKTETPVTANDIIGNWEIIAAKRNGKITSTLKGGYFKFDAHNKMGTNILGADQEFEYQLNGNTISQIGGEETSYRISNISNDTIQINSKIMNFSFEFVAVKNDAL